jgi:molybdopterin-guanine dinucleotide biosynthesis protein A
MDDFPAGPTGPGPRRPSLSVVIPVHNGGPDFERCLRRLRDSTWTDFELVVVDDASTDGSAAVAESFGAEILRFDSPGGPAAARNAGAEFASSPIIFFLDADVALHADALAIALSQFQKNPDLTALFGSYDAEPAAPGLVSKYRNLLHHYIHQRGTFIDGARPVQTFWTGCGAIRRQVFLDLGGFDPHLYRRPAIEDIELGYRMTRAGLKIELVREVQATHLKRWTLFEVLRTDIFQRGVPWMLLLKRSHVVESDLNVSPSQRACVVATGLGGLALGLVPWAPALVFVALVCQAIIILLNWDFYRFLARRGGPLFAVASAPLHLVYYCCCGLSVAIALVLFHFPIRHRASPPGRAPSGQRLDVAAQVAPQSLHTSRPRRPTPWTNA